MESKPISLGAGASANPKASKPTQSAPAPSPPTGPATDAQLLLFHITECKTFYTRLANAVQTAIEEGQQPVSVLKGGKAGLPSPKTTPKPKRKPTAFNIFVSKKCEQMRAKGGIGPGQPENNAVFGQAAAAWRALSDEQRQAFSQRYAADNDDPALDDLPEPEADAEAEAKPTATLTDAAKTAEKKRKKEEAVEPSKEANGQAPPADGEGQKKKKKKKKSAAPTSQ